MLFRTSLRVLRAISGLGGPQGNSEHTAEGIKNIQWRGGGAEK